MKKLFTLILLLIFAQSKSQMPNWAWARSAPSGTSGYAEGYGIATDALGNVYIGGSYHDTIIFGTSIFPDFNGMFIAKYDSLGNLKWGKNIHGVGYGNNVATDLYGNVYLAGWFQTPTVIFDSDTLTNAGAIDMFLAKYDSSGNFIWAKRAGGTLGEQGFDVSTDAIGNIYVSGNFGSPTINFGSYVLTNADSIADVFLVKYDSSGNILWAKSAGGSSLEQGKGVTADSFGNVFITGYFNSPFMVFGFEYFNKFR